jgi:AhpD family alkylhydroperoxidase
MTTAVEFKVPTGEEVSAGNQQTFAQLKKGIGFLPNLYAYYGKNETALQDYLALQNRKTTLNPKEKEVVNLVTSQINDCKYCQAAHTALGQRVGFTEDEILDIRRGNLIHEYKLDALAEFTASVVLNRGKVSDDDKELFFGAGYTEANLIDVVMLIGDKTISNLIHNVTSLPVDFPLAQPIS